MPPAPGSMSLSSRTAIADGRKKTTIASSHNPRLASPNWLAAVVSQRSPTMALMLSSTTSRARWGRCSRRAIARYAVATENAAAAWPDGNERRLSRFEAAAGAADVYSTGRLRCASTLIHWVVASVHASALANTTTWPRTAAALAPSAEASPANPATATSSAWLAVPAGRENVCNAARSMPGSEAGSHGDDTQRQRHGPTGHAVSVER